MNEPHEVDPFQTPMPRPTKAKIPAVLLSIAAMCGVIALPLAIRGVYADQALNRERERERIQSDLDSCERGNDNRRLQLRLHTAQRDYVDEVLSEVLSFAQVSEAERAVLIAGLAVPKAHIDDAIAEIKVVDCLTIVAGADQLEDQ